MRFRNLMPSVENVIFICPNNRKLPYYGKFAASLSIWLTVFLTNCKHEWIIMCIKCLGDGRVSTSVLLNCLFWEFSVVFMLNCGHASSISFMEPTYLLFLVEWKNKLNTLEKKDWIKIHLALSIVHPTFDLFTHAFSLSCTLSTKNLILFGEYSFLQPGLRYYHWWGIKST